MKLVFANLASAKRSREDGFCEAYLKKLTSAKCSAATLAKSQSQDLALWRSLSGRSTGMTSLAEVRLRRSGRMTICAGVRPRPRVRSWVKGAFPIARARGEKLGYYSKAGDDDMFEISSSTSYDTASRGCSSRVLTIVQHLMIGPLKSTRQTERWSKVWVGILCQSQVGLGPPSACCTSCSQAPRAENVFLSLCGEHPLRSMVNLNWNHQKDVYCSKIYVTHL